MRLILKIVFISFFLVGLKSWALTADYVSAFKPKNKTQTLTEFQKNLNSDLYKTRRKIQSPSPPTDSILGANPNSSQKSAFVF